MSGVNKAIILGNLGGDPEIKYTKTGDAVCTLSVATSEKWKDKATGEQREATEWHRCILWRKLAEIAGQYLHKGDKVYLDGSIKTRKWQDQSGQDRYSTEIQVRDMQMLGGRGGRGGTGGDSGHRHGPAGRAGADAAPAPRQDFDSDVPF